jgi:hypothetical protein
LSPGQNRAAAFLPRRSCHKIMPISLHERHKHIHQDEWKLNVQQHVSEIGSLARGDAFSVGSCGLDKSETVITGMEEIDYVEASF